MPRQAKHNRKKVVALESYDPSTAKDQSKIGAAHHWELLRRNIEYGQIAGRWIADPKFRAAHSSSPDYHHSQVHFQRCALDWMISGPARVKLARIQLSANRWFMDTRFNFGPIIATQTRHRLDIRENETALNAFTVQPIPNPPRPLRLDQAWPETPELFRNQFNFAVAGDSKFQVVTQPIRELADYLHQVAARLHQNDSPEKLPEIIGKLFGLGEYLHDLAEFHRLFAIPSAHCSPGGLSKHLDEIRKHCSAAGQIAGRYSAHASWLGTHDQWRFFLIAERLRYDPGIAAHMYKLAGIYSEDLRKGLYSRSTRKDAKSHGFKGSKVPSKAIRGRRPTVRMFVTQIQEWIANIYPPKQWLAYTRPPLREPSEEISPPS